MREPQECIRFDWAMKYRLRDPANFGILEGFLTVVLGRPIKVEGLGEGENLPMSSEDKMRRVDLMCRDVDGEIVQIEVQNCLDPDFFKRILYGVSATVVDSVRAGKKYERVPKVICVSIVYFDLGDPSHFFFHGKMRFEDGDGNPGYRTSPAEGAPDAADIFPEYYILQLKKFKLKNNTPLEQWADYLRNGLVPEQYNAPGLALVREELKYDLLDRDERRAYRKRLDDENMEKYEKEVDRRNTIDAVAENLRKTLRKQGFDNEAIERIVAESTRLDNGDTKETK